MVFSVEKTILRISEKQDLRMLKVLEEKLYMEGDQVDDRKITSLVIRMLSIRLESMRLAAIP
jgi:hypothetical protein